MHESYQEKKKQKNKKQKTRLYQIILVILRIYWDRKGSHWSDLDKTWGKSSDL